MESETITLLISQEDCENYKRLDQYLSEKLELSRSIIKNLFEEKNIQSEHKLKLNKMPKVSIEVTVIIPPAKPSEIQAEDIPLDILFEDDHLIIINKHAGMVVHPAPGNYTGTLVNALLHHCPDLKGIGGVQRPGIVHRLDKGTSGIMVVAKDQKTHEGLTTLFSEHDIQREYETLILSKQISPIGTVQSMYNRHPKNRLKMTSRISTGKEAVTHYKILKSWDLLHHLRVTLETGRTHQIRVHLSEQLHSPIINDDLYGNPKQQILRCPEAIRELITSYPYPLLHARKLGFIHPITKEELVFTQDAPSPFSEVMEILNAHC